jgi:hypothetical protein
MIGKAEWFQRRKYTGWGIMPKTWQGGVYLAVILLPFVVFQALPFWDIQTRIIVTTAWMVFLLLDVTHIMATLRRDERESKIEAISERNAAWAMVLIVAIGVVYQSVSSALQQKIQFDPFLVAALFGGMIAKMLSNLWLERKLL